MTTLPLLLTKMMLFFHNVISSMEKPSGLVKVTKWTAALAKQRAVIKCAAIKATECAAKEAEKHAADQAKEHTAKQKHVNRSHALTFGPGSKDWSFITPSCMATPASVLSSTAPTSSTPAADVDSERWSEGKPAIVQAFGGFHNETDNFEELVSVLGKWGSSSVCGSMHGHYTLYHCFLLF